MLQGITAMSDEVQDRSSAPRQRRGRCLVATWVDQPVYDALHADAVAQDRTLAATIRKRLREFYFPQSGNHSEPVQATPNQAALYVGDEALS